MTSMPIRFPGQSEEEYERILARNKEAADRRGWGDIRPDPRRPGLDKIRDRKRSGDDPIVSRRPVVSRRPREKPRHPDDLGPVMDRIGPDRPVGPDTDRWGRPKGTVYFDRRHEKPGKPRGYYGDDMLDPRYGRSGRPGRRGGYRDRPNLIRDIRRSGEIPQDWDRKDPTRRGGGRGRGGWWNEPRRPEPRREYPTELSDRLSSDAERMRLLTGESDRVKSPDSSKLLRDDYDPVDREFNRQFDEAPRGRQPWHSDPTGNPLEKDPLADYDFRGGRSTRRTPERTDSSGWPGKKPKRNIKNRGEEEARIQPMPSPPSVPEPPKEPKYGRWQDAELPGPKRDREWGEDFRPGEVGLGGYEGPGNPRWERENPREVRPYDDTDLKKRLAALEERGPIITQPTQDLSGITGRLSELEGRKPDTSWKDPLSAVQAGQTQGQEARSALDTRLTALEKYYKNDPPPADSVGDRYEDKYNQLNKLWEREGKATKWGDDALKETGYRGKENWDYSYAGDQGQAWAGDLPEGYVQGVRDLNREYNRPTLEAIIKGREYKAYDPRAAARLRYLDKENIHEDTYLGRGTWDNKYGEKVYGRGKGDEARYFASQSGLEKDSDEYTKRFQDIIGRTGKDYAWYK